MFLVFETSCLAVAVQTCMELIPIEKKVNIKGNITTPIREKIIKKVEIQPDQLPLAAPRKLN